MDREHNTSQRIATCVALLMLSASCTTLLSPKKGGRLRLRHDVGVEALATHRRDADQDTCSIRDMAVLAVVTRPDGSTQLEAGDYLRPALESGARTRAAKLAPRDVGVPLDKTPLDGLHIDALSLGQDILRLQHDKGQWTLERFDVDDDHGWAIITYLDSSAAGVGLPGVGSAGRQQMRTLAWGPDLHSTVSPLPVRDLPGVHPSLLGASTPVPPGHVEPAPLDLLDVSESSSRVQGYDHVSWHLWSTDNPRCEPDADPLASNRLKIYFSIDRSHVSEMRTRLDPVTRADKRWESGAAIFSYTLTLGTGGPEWSKFASLEFAPDRDGDRRGFSSGDDIDALAIDHLNGVALVSLTEDSESMTDPELVPSSFYAMGLLGPGEKPKPKHWPSPLYAYGHLLDDWLRETPATASLAPMPQAGSSDPRPPINPSGTCGKDPSSANQ